MDPSASVYIVGWPRYHLPCRLGRTPARIGVVRGGPLEATGERRTMTEKKFDLSRRKVLGSLGVIGTGAVVGGAGTAALFSDEERSNSNTVEAGTLDLKMDWSYTANQDIAATQSGSGGAGASFTIGDLKPGDSGHVEVCFEPESNPAYIWLKMEEQADRDAYNTEPERVAEGDSIDSDTPGELDDEMNARLVYADNGNVIEGWDSLHNVVDALSSGRLLDSDSSDDYFSADHERCVKLEWEIPTSVGNVIQGDVAKFDIVLFAEQARHNSNPSNPF